MQNVRASVRPLLLIACVALLATGGCVLPPIVFHDGLPAWTPGAGKPEGSIGYHRIYWYNSGEYVGSAWYLTPGFRVGLGRPPLAADIGLTSMVVESDGEFGALVGAALGIGYQRQNFGFMVRPSAYVMSIGGGDVRFGLDDPLWQFSLLAGNGNQPGAVHFSGGGRVGRLGVGPVFLADRTVGPVNLRLETSYTFAYNDDAAGRLLSVGFTIGGPAPGSDDEAGLGDYQ